MLTPHLYFPEPAQQRECYHNYRRAGERLYQANEALRRAQEQLAADPDNEDLGCKVDDLLTVADRESQDLDVAMTNLLAILPLPAEVRDSETVVAIMGERLRPVPELI